MKKVSIAIIGAGSGGLSARSEISKKTDDYLVFDGGTLGTTCARVGCMPSKVLIQVAEDFHRRTKFEEEGINGGENLTVNTAQVMSHVRKLRDRFVRAVNGGMESWEGNKLIREYVKFKSPHILETENGEFEAEKIIIATGSKPLIPKELDSVKDYIITTDQFFELETLPSSVMVVGLGVIGLELGQALTRLGVNVFGVARRESLGGITDPKLKQYAIEKFSDQMNLSFQGIESVHIEGDKVLVKSGGKEVFVEKILVTSGRTPVWSQLGIENLGMELKPWETPDFNPYTRQLQKFPHIFIAGDNSGELQILHEASDEGKIAGYNCINPIKEFRPRTPLLIAFSDPNIVQVGLSFEELTNNQIQFEIGEVSFEGQGRSIIKLKELGMLRVYGDRKTGVLLGAEMLAPDGEHLGHLLSWVIAQNLTVNQVLSLPFYHPVIEEGLRTALRDLRGKVEETSFELEVAKE